VLSLTAFRKVSRVTSRNFNKGETKNNILLNATFDQWRQWHINLEYVAFDEHWKKRESKMQEDMRAENRARLVAAQKPAFRDELFFVVQV
jgi:hypothetical protein